MEETKHEERTGGVNQWVQERGRGEEQAPKEHHLLAPEYVRERPRWQLDEDPRDGGRSHDQADQLGSGPEIMGETRQDGAPGHLVTEPRQEAYGAELDKEGPHVDRTERSAKIV